MLPSALLALATAHALGPIAIERNADDAAAPSSEDDADLPVAIVGGERSEPSAWPAVVALFDDEGAFSCTGTLIAPDLVLSAGHCGTGIEAIHVGSSDLAADLGDIYGITETWVHPDYYTTYDVALYRLDAEVPGVEPLPILRDCLVQDYLDDGVDGLIVGYGAIDRYASDKPTALYEAVVPIHDADCVEPGRGCHADLAPGGELLAGGDGVDSCLGDSGGPLFLDTAEGMLITGIVSRAAVPSRYPCGEGGIYVRADAVLPWIEESIGEPLPPAECEGVNRSPRLAEAEITTNRLRTGGVVLSVLDPNDDQQHTLSIVGTPDHGLAWLDGHTLLFRPDPVWHGTTSVTIEVVDDGEPPRSSTAEVPVIVRDVRTVAEAKGCATSPTPGGLWWLFPLLYTATARGSSGGRRTRMGSRRP